MNSEHALHTIIAGSAMAIALASLLIQWLSADDSPALAPALLRRFVAAPEPTLPAWGTGEIAPVLHNAPPANDVTVDAKPELTADDETAVARLCFGWGTAGTLAGLAFGGMLGGFTGAVAGCFVLAPLSIGLVVLFIVVRDRGRISARTA